MTKALDPTESGSALQLAVRLPRALLAALDGEVVRLTAALPGVRRFGRSDAVRAILHRVLLAPAGSPEAARPGSADADVLRQRLLALRAAEEGTNVRHRVWRSRAVAAKLGVHTTTVERFVTGHGDLVRSGVGPALDKLMRAAESARGVPMPARTASAHGAPNATGRTTPGGVTRGRPPKRPRGGGAASNTAAGSPAPASTIVRPRTAPR